MINGYRLGVIACLSMGAQACGNVQSSAPHDWQTPPTASAPASAPSAPHASVGPDAGQLPPSESPRARGDFANPPLMASGNRAPITGGSMAIAGNIVVLAQPARDAVALLDISNDTNARLRATISLGLGDEPGRVEIAGNTAFVALRGGGAIARIDTQSGTLLGRFDTCSAPRGLAWDDTREELYVACADGRLVILDQEGNERRRLELEPDLRDVVLGAQGRVFVSTFRSAEVFVIEHDRVVDRWTIPAEEAGDFLPRVAWRMRPTPDGHGVYILSQEHSVRATMMEEPEEIEQAPSPRYYGSIAEPRERLVRTVLSELRQGESSRALIDVALAVDFITHGEDFFVASAATSLQRPRSLLRINTREHGNRLQNTELLDHDTMLQSRRGTTALAVGPYGPVAYQREQGTIVTFRAARNAFGGYFTHGLPTPVSEPREDTATEIFHVDPFGGITCASCHPEGRDDGHVWKLDGVPRRTQSLTGGLLSTAPFHWAGDVAGLTDIMATTFRMRMGGPELSEEQVQGLGLWLDRLVALKAPAQDSQALAHGEAVFSESGCESCHSGPMGTNNQTIVSGDQRLQVPPLVALAVRAPYFHDGCAPDLESLLRGCELREQPEHAVAANLGEDELAALLVYLRSR